jgi:hypothetical protein
MNNLKKTIKEAFTAFLQKKVSGKLLASQDAWRKKRYEVR